MPRRVDTYLFPDPTGRFEHWRLLELDFEEVKGPRRVLRQHDPQGLRKRAIEGKMGDATERQSLNVAPCLGEGDRVVRGGGYGVLAGNR